LDASIPFWMYLIGFPLLLGPLITLHELGHYLVGRWFGVEAEAFSVGFGKEMAGWTDSRGTRWKLSALPLGGYVQFKGDMNPASVPDGKAPEDGSRGGFHQAALWKRALIVFAGPATNVLIALAIFASFFALYGQPVAADPERQLTIEAFAEQSPAREAGLEVGDRILAIEGQRVEDFAAVQDAVMLYPGRTLAFTVARDGTERSYPVTVRAEEMTDRFGNSSKIGLVGIRSAGSDYVYERAGPVAAVGLAVDHSIGVMDMMLTGIAQIFTGERSVQELGGPVKIAKYSGEQLSMGAITFVNFVALISLNLAFINLLPIPALDGGHLAFYAAEAIRRKPVGQRSQELAYRTGMALVLMLMIFVTINDLVSLPVFGN
jgi:regulator of sigma E protease